MAATVTAPSATHNEARQAAQDYLNQRLASGASAKPARPFTVPEINIANSFSDDVNARKTVAAKIHDACTNSGFFHLTGHGVSEETRQKIINAAKRFTKDLPRSSKEALHVKHSKYFRGWEPADYTYVNPGDWSAETAAPETKEGFNWGYEPGLDPTGGDGQYRELDGEDVNGNVWPKKEDLPGFYADVKEYYGQILQLARHLFRLFALSLDLPEEYFDDMMTHPGGISRLLYYPASKDPKPLNPNEPDKEIGLGAHSDYECFTILLCSTASGLEILSPENIWVPAPAVEGSFIINVADFLMRWTNGVYISTVHRVVNRTTHERYSVPFFFNINYDQTVETLPSCVTPERPSQYPPVKAGEYILERLKAVPKMVRYWALYHTLDLEISHWIFALRNLFESLYTVQPTRDTVSPKNLSRMCDAPLGDPCLHIGDGAACSVEYVLRYWCRLVLTAVEVLL
ncbi:2-oxoglutarate-Fe(II) type oxidoreductase hxnY [Fulvia fulva]|nr:2-oxoglutarate-Fe(II) type oxidoreductase hxnY [Fulvia fulva]WPV08645.1 2-oxoglutarate-Fe(II) type oxidoreductase hxnY [Fulvia fulva]WPV23409.1 2-oxoglutarate-Fe(II) type oxidoreductase hxnY [Fulvia fulva]